MRAAEQAVQASDPWLAAVRTAVADPELPRLHPLVVVDLAGAEVAGYHVVCSFPGPPSGTAEQWLAVAARAGLRSHVEARVLRRVVDLRRMLDLRQALGRGALLSVSVSAELLGSEPVLDVVAEAGSLEGVVVRVAGAGPNFAAAQAALTTPMGELRASGARIAVETSPDHAGATALATLRPDFAVLVPRTVSGLDRDESRLAAVRALAGHAARSGATLLADGIGTEDELRALGRVGVRLGSGPLLGEPGTSTAHLPGLAPGGAAAVWRAKAATGAPGHVASLMEEADHVAANDPEQPHSGQVVVEVDRAGRAVAIRHATGAAVSRTALPALLTVAPAERIQDAARRAMRRAAVYRWEPMVCTDSAGRALGIVRVERLVEALADLHSE